VPVDTLGVFVIASATAWPMKKFTAEAKSLQSVSNLFSLRAVRRRGQI
jgi:hypothetical protein